MTCQCADAVLISALTHQDELGIADVKVDDTPGRHKIVYTCDHGKYWYAAITYDEELTLKERYPHSTISQKGLQNLWKDTGGNLEEWIAPEFLDSRVRIPTGGGQMKRMWAYVRRTWIKFQHAVGRLDNRDKFALLLGMTAVVIVITLIMEELT